MTGATMGVLILAFIGAVVVAFVASNVRIGIMKRKEVPGKARFFALAFLVTFVAFFLFISWGMRILEHCENAYCSSCASNIRQIGLGCLLYSQDWGGYTPPNLQSTFPYMNGETRVYFCPKDAGSEVQGRLERDQIVSQLDFWSSYQLCDQVKLDTIEDKEAYPLLWEKRPFPCEGKALGLHIFFADGHFEYVSLQDFAELLDKQQDPKGPRHD